MDKWLSRLRSLSVNGSDPQAKTESIQLDQTSLLSVSDSATSGKLLENVQTPLKPEVTENILRTSKTAPPLTAKSPPSTLLPVSGSAISGKPLEFSELLESARTLLAARVWESADRRLVAALIAALENPKTWDCSRTAALELLTGMVNQARGLN